MTTDTLVAGGLTEDGGLEIAAPTEIDELSFRYTPYEGIHAASSGAYALPITTRLSVTLRPSEAGWIARAPELGALGHGETRDGALDDLRDAITQYLEFIRDDKPTLAPDIAHHAPFVQLLDTPPELWFASVELHAATLE
jgi:predicted RNase H-like HicB family nuclease